MFGFITVGSICCKGNIGYRFKLSKIERPWLEDNPVITFAGDPNWLPYEAFDQSGQYIGIGLVLN